MLRDLFAAQDLAYAVMRRREKVITFSDAGIAHTAACLLRYQARDAVITTKLRRKKPPPNNANEATSSRE
jgi:DNA-binding MurR/RpiR family transcriptional regulator